MLLDDGLRLHGDASVEIAGLTADSRAVRPGDLFAALPGTRVDGTAFVDEALARGAVALLGGARLLERETAVPVLVAEDPRRAFSRLAARFHPGRPAFVAAVTGTNGKSSTASFARQLWAATGYRAASLGTLGLEPADLGEVYGLTTPDPVTLHRVLDTAASRGVDRFVLEASSHGLDQRRLDGLQVDAAGFTNLSRDHFDYHGDVEAYFAAKARLFGELLRPGGAAVLNADAPEFHRLAAIVSARGARVISYGRQGHDLRLLALEPQPEGLSLELAAGGSSCRVVLPLYGTFQAWNVLCAAGIALAGGLVEEQLTAALSALEGVPGRMQLIARTASGARAFVDYAHTPDALDKALRALRAHVDGRITVVFGCGGDRDPGKRPLMGRIASELADQVVVTDDNPRTEDPRVIRAQIMAGCGERALEVGDRAEAIATGLRDLGPSDALLVAGKGHERGQIVGERVLPFDDAEILRALVAGTGAAA